LREAPGVTAKPIEHIGSTTTPRLDAKPTIDIEVSVADLHNLDRYRGPVEQLGYTRCEHSLGDLDPRFFAAPEGAAHIHVCHSGNEWERRYLLFRDDHKARTWTHSRFGS